MTCKYHMKITVFFFFFPIKGISIPSSFMIPNSAFVFNYFKKLHLSTQRLQVVYVNTILSGRILNITFKH